MNIKATVNDEELEFEVLYSGVRSRATHYISQSDGTIWLIGKNGGKSLDQLTREQLLVLPRTRRTLNGVVYEETGDYTYPHEDDWYWRNGRVENQGSVKCFDFASILRPVDINNQPH